MTGLYKPTEKDLDNLGFLWRSGAVVHFAAGGPIRIELDSHAAQGEEFWNVIRYFRQLIEGDEADEDLLDHVPD